MASTNDAKNEPVFYATFEDPGKDAIDEWKKSLGAVEKRGENRDHSEYVSYHTDKAHFATDRKTGAHAWEIKLSALGEAKLEEHFKNVKYFATWKDAMSGSNSLPKERLAAAVKNAQKPEWLQRIADFKAGRRSEASPVDAVRYIAAQARFLGGFSKKPFNGDIKEYVSKDLLFQMDASRSGLKPLASKLAAISADLTNAAVIGRKDRIAIQKDLEKARASGNKGAEAMAQNKLMFAQQKCVAEAVRSFPRELQDTIPSVRSLNEMKSYNEAKKNGSLEERKPKQGMIDAQAFIDGKSKTLDAKAVKSWAMSVASSMFRDWQKDDSEIKQALDSDKILNASADQIKDGIRDGASIAKALPAVKEKIAKLASDAHKTIASGFGTCSNDRERNALIYSTTAGLVFKAVEPLGNIREAAITKELDRKQAARLGSGEFKHAAAKTAARKPKAQERELGASMSR